MSDSQVDKISEAETNYGKGKAMFEFPAIAALLKEAARLNTEHDSHATDLEPSVQYARPAVSSSEENLSEEEKRRLLNLQQLRIKFLRLAQRLGYTAESSIVPQVMYKLIVFTGRPRDPAYSFDVAKQIAIKLEAEKKDDLNFSVNILVLGKTGVGKSATINSIFGEEKVKINAFKPETTCVQEIFGVLDGVKIRVIDVPGLKSCAMEQGFNNKILAKVKKFVRKYPPDVTLYVDRLDSQTRYMDDFAMLRTITRSLGSSIWQDTILTLTHAASAPPDGSMGTPVSYDTYVSRASQLIQKSIIAAVDDYSVMNLQTVMPVSLVENHPACRKNQKAEKVLPNGEIWRNKLLLQCYSVKVLSEAGSTSKPSDSIGQRMMFGFLQRTPPLAYLVSSLLKSRAHPELPASQGCIPDSMLDYFSDEEEDEYDELPPFRPLRKSEVAKLSEDQKKVYYQEYDYREKLLQKKQWREKCRIQRELKRLGKKSILDDYGEMPDMFDAENEPSSSAPPETSPDVVLPLSFDPNFPSYLYRTLEDPNPIISAAPLIDTRGWDHDYGHYGVNIQRNMGVAGTFPAEFMVHLNKDKDVFRIFLDSAISAKHGESNSSMLGFEAQTIDDQLAYTLRSESKHKISKKSKSSGGVSLTLLGEDVVPGLKLEHEVDLGRRLVISGKAGTVYHQKNAASAANLEVRLRGADYPVDSVEHLFAVNLLKYRGEMAVEANIQPQFQIGRSSKMVVNVGLNSRSIGQIIMTTSSSNPTFALLGTLVSMTIASYYHYKAYYHRRISENYSAQCLQDSF